MTPELLAGLILLVFIVGGLLYQYFQFRWQAKQDQLITTINVLIDGQQKTNQAVMSAVQTMSEANSKQSEVLSTYLKLFQSPGEPQRWEDDPVERNTKELAELGFPAEGTDEEQAQWVLKNLDRL